MYLAGAIINAMIGLFFINLGINRLGKKRFFSEFGYVYISIVIIGTLILMLKAI